MADIRDVGSFPDVAGIENSRDGRVLEEPGQRRIFFVTTRIVKSNRSLRQSTLGVAVIGCLAANTSSREATTDEEVIRELVDHRPASFAPRIASTDDVLRASFQVVQS